MIRFIAKRLGWMVLTLWIVFTVAFFLMRAVPGGPFQEDRKLPPEIEANIRAQFNLDAPLHEQYLTHLGRAAQLDFGSSYKLKDFTVNEVIAQGFPISASLGIFALVFAFTLGTAAGIISALRRQSWLDVSFMAMATLGIAVPNFVLASLCIVLFVFTMKLLPAAGWGSLEQIILPALCLGAPFAAYIARLTRTGMLDVLSQDFIKTAYAKGLHPRRVILRHALRGAILPVVSYLGPATAGILTGSLVLERIFALPGMGSHFIDAATQRDYTLAMGMVLVYTLLLYTMNMLVDISYALIDPRVRLD
ncbi:MAG: ABC transporter permease subunit [Pirellulales bacterium]